MDVSQSVDLDHPYALDFLRADALHVNTFFRRKGVSTLTTRELFEFAVDPSIRPDNMEQAVAALLAVAEGRSCTDQDDTDDAVCHPWASAALAGHSCWLVAAMQTLFCRLCLAAHAYGHCCKVLELTDIRKQALTSPDSNLSAIPLMAISRLLRCAGRGGPCSCAADDSRCLGGSLQVFAQAFIPRKLEEVEDHEGDFERLEAARGGHCEGIYYQVITGMKADMTGARLHPSICEQVTPPCKLKSTLVSCKDAWSDGMTLLLGTLHALLKIRRMATAWLLLPVPDLVAIRSVCRHMEVRCLRFQMPTVPGLAAVP